MWLILSLASGIFYTLQGLLTRHVLKGNRDAWAFSFYFSFVGALTSLPFVLMNPKFAKTPTLWLLIFVVGGLIVLQNYLNFKSTNYLEASIQGAITKFRLLWVLIIGVVLLGETLSSFKVIGTLLTITAGLVIYLKTVDLQSKKGVYLAFSATIVYAIVIGFYKLLFTEFNSATLTFFIFAIPALLNIFIMPNSIERIKEMAKSQGKVVFFATFLGGLANLTMNQALSMDEASRVLVIIESFLIILLLGEHIFLKEKANFKRKLIAVVLATVGAILIRLSSS